MSTAGFKSVIARWLGGNTGQPVTQVGWRSVIFRWVGGIAPPPTVTPQPGWRSPIARWVGGLAATQAPVVEPPSPVSSGGGLRLRQASLTKRITGVAVSGNGTESAGRGTYLPLAVRGRCASGSGAESEALGVYTPVRIFGTAESSALSGYVAHGDIDNSIPELIREEDELLLLTLD